MIIPFILHSGLASSILIVSRDPLRRGGFQNTPEQWALVPAQQSPGARLSYPGLREPHKPLTKAGIARLAAKCRKPADVPRVSDHQEVQLARAPFERLPERSLPGVEVDVVDEVLLAHSPGKIFIQNLSALVERLPESVEISFVETVLPRGERGFEFRCCTCVTHRRCLTAEGVSLQEVGTTIGKQVRETLRGAVTGVLA